ncbi:FKBP-type peptidyl-prolyl cis-trans isomerase [Candidatus Micrarchaeota archaeon]|nr:FKBP-type peptidyl-prolyl cis-trans isomerase [Candidatus Micrarchaeota archaeon]
MQKNTVVWIGLLIGILILFGCTSGDGNSQNLSPLNRSTSNLSLSPGIVHLGDRVSVYYSLFVDGRLIDTNIWSLVNSSNSTNSTSSPNSSHFRPLVFNAALDGSMIPGFVQNVVGMKLNETKNFTVSPAQGYGLYDPNKVVRVDRYYEKSLYETVNRSDLIAAGMKNITKGRQVPVKQGTVFISSINGDEVVLYYLLLPGATFEINGVPQRVDSAIDDNLVRIEYDLALNQTYNLPDPRTGKLGIFRVQDKTNDSIVLDGNHFLANKSLDFQVTVLNITRGG